MPETIILAVADVVKEITALVRTVMEGQTPEQRGQLWDWYIKDVAAWRKFIGLDKEEK